LHTLPPYRDERGAGGYPVAESLAARGLNLPSSALLTRDDVEYVTTALRRALN